MRRLSSIKLVLVSTFFALALSACATSRSVITVEAPVGEQPKSSAFIKITEVRDLREFALNPKDPSLPSLGSEVEIRDPKITERAVARKRNGYGQALGDVTLPEGMSVASLVRLAAKKALQDKGYVVVDETSPDYAGAQALTIDVDQFWAWMQPGFTTLTFTFNSAVGLKGSGSVLVTDPSLVRSQTVVTSGFGTESVWIETIKKGLVEMAEQMKVHIRSPSAPPSVSQNEGTTAGSSGAGS